MEPHLSPPDQPFPEALRRHRAELRESMSALEIRVGRASDRRSGTLGSTSPCCARGTLRHCCMSVDITTAQEIFRMAAALSAQGAVLSV